MIESRLLNRLTALDSMRQRARLWRRLAVCWAATAAAGLLLFLVRAAAGIDVRPAWWLVILCGAVAAIVIWIREQNRPRDLRSLAAELERDNAEVGHLLSTALEQQADAELGRFNYLQLRVIEAALNHPRRVLWEQELRRKQSTARKCHAAAFAAFILLLGFGAGAPHLLPGQSHPWLAQTVTVMPGDTTVERGAGVVVTARFTGRMPADATLVVVSASGKTQRIPMARNLADPVFGASLRQVSEDSLYRVEYASSRTPDYKIGVFEYPALVRADAYLHYPEFTGLTNKVIRDTRRVSAIEGTRLTYLMQLNKPVASAKLIGKDQTLPLTLQSNAVVSLNEWVLTNSARYSLQLVDAEGRTNKMADDFSLVALADRPPEVKIVFPHGDQRVSALQEMQLDGEATDEFGLLEYGVGYSLAGQEPQFVELSREPAGPNQKRQFSYLLPLETLGVHVDQVVSYFAWADDHGPDGGVRRTFSDMYFAEVRPFEEIFRQDQSGGQDGSQGGAQGGAQGGNGSTRLAELQKQIVLATWKLQRDRESAVGTKK
jgi:hypothetical protein